MTEKLYLEDAYLRTCRARVAAAPAPGQVVLDRTVLYAESGGQAPDHGTLRWEGGSARVTDSQYAPGSKQEIRHTIEGDAPPVGTEVEVEVDWPRRFGLMRVHTAVHVFTAILHSQYRASFTGNQLYPERARFDVEFPEWRPEMKEQIEREVNAAIAKGYPVRNYSIPRAEFEARAAELLRTKENLVDPSLQMIRMTDIVGLDCQADGGTHVRSTAEVGRVVIEKVDNKGKGHRRITFHLE